MGEILGIIIVAVVFILIERDSNKREEKQQQERQQQLSDSIDHTEIVSKTTTDTVFRVYYRNGNTQVVDIGVNNADYNIYFQKLI